MSCIDPNFLLNIVYLAAYWIVRLAIAYYIAKFMLAKESSKFETSFSKRKTAY